jgi:glycosyltransferase involved in cell wall biosynthesis
VLCSIIIPLYNKEQFIRSAIQSVLNQTYQDFEIVVVDDGSKDQGAELVQDIPDARIRLIKQKNGGVSRARNRGIEEARGVLVCFLDADDWYDKKYLETIVTMAQKYPFGNFFATNFKPVYAYRPEEWDHTEVDFSAVGPVNNFYERRYRSGPFVHTNSVAVWRKDLKELQPCFPVGESLGEDQDLWFRLIDRLNLIYCPAQLVAYRYEVAGSLFTTKESRALSPVFVRLEQRARQGVIKKSDRRFAFLIAADERISIARHLLANNKRIDALKILSKSARAASKKRWWLTLFMCGFGSPLMMKKWDEKRLKQLNIQ